MARIKLWGEPEHEKFFVSLERTPLVLANLRKQLPELRRELSKKWPVMYVGIQQPPVRRRNPINPHEVVKAAEVMLAIYLGSTAKSAGEETGPRIVKAVSKWIKEHSYKPRPRAKTHAKRRARR